MPSISAMSRAINLYVHKLVAGDVPEVVTKIPDALDKIRTWTAEANQLRNQMNALADQVDDDINTLTPIARLSVDVAGAERGTEAFRAAIEAVPVTVDDAANMRELNVSGIAPSPGRALSEIFVAEQCIGGARWAGPLLLFDDTFSEFDAPVANAGSDRSVYEGNALTVNASRSTADESEIVAWRWTEGSTILGQSEELDVNTDSAGTRSIQLVVTDARGAQSAPYTVTITIQAQPNTPTIDQYELTINPSGNPPVKITNNQSYKAYSIRSERRPVFLPGGNRILVSSGTPTKIDRSDHEILDLQGRVKVQYVGSELHAMASFVDADNTYGVIFSAVGDDFVRAYISRSVMSDLLFQADRTRDIDIGGGQGRISNDDKYIVIRRETTNQLLTLDIESGAIVGSMIAPTGHEWASITPDGAYVLMQENGGIYRYERDYSGRARISQSVDNGDCVIGNDGRCYFIQSGATPSLIDVAANTSTAINTGNEAASGSVSGVSLVPGLICVAWRVGSVHEVATMNVAKGAAMWTDRDTWTALPAGVETREYAKPIAVPSPDGQVIIYRSAATPGSGLYDLYRVE